MCQHWPGTDFLLISPATKVQPQLSPRAGSLSCPGAELTLCQSQPQAIKSLWPYRSSGACAGSLWSNLATASPFTGCRAANTACPHPCVTSWQRSAVQLPGLCHPALQGTASTCQVCQHPGLPTTSLWPPQPVPSDCRQPTAACLDPALT